MLILLLQQLVMFIFMVITEGSAQSLSLRSNMRKSLPALIGRSLVYSSDISRVAPSGCLEMVNKTQ